MVDTRPLGADARRIAGANIAKLPALLTVEIDVSVAGQSSTYIFNCVRDGQFTVIQLLGMR